MKEFQIQFKETASAVESVKCISNLAQRANEPGKDFFFRVGNSTYLSCRKALEAVPADGTFNGVKASCLVDTGASISVIAHSIFELIPNTSSLPSFPVSPSWRLSAVTGNKLELVGKHEFEVRILGRTFFRPFFVVKGMAKTEAILGYDFIREAQLAISCNHVFF